MNKKYIFLITFILCIIIIPQTKYVKNIFKLKEIEITQLSFLKIEEILDIIALPNDISILDIDVLPYQKKLEQNFWVQKAEITKKYPNIIKINVTEKKPKYIWENKQKIYILNESGDILTEISIDELPRFDNLIVVIGNDVTKFLLNLTGFIETDQYIYQKINLLEWVGNRRWNIKFVNDMILKLSQENPKGSWKKFIEMNQKLHFFDNQIKTVDLTVNNRIFIGE